MQLGASLIQYAVVGTLFWLGSLTALVLLAPDVVRAFWLIVESVDLRPELGTAFNGLLAAFAVSAVFATGLALDSAGILWYRREGEWLLQEAVHHEPWLRSFFSMHASYLGEDVALLSAQLGKPPEEFPKGLWYRFPNRAYKREVAAIQERVDARGRAGARLLGLLVALSTSSDEIKRQVEMWRTKRGITLALVCIGWSSAASVVLQFSLGFVSSVVGSPSQAQQSMPILLGEMVRNGLVAVVVAAVLTSLAALLSRRAFEDFALALFPHTYREAYEAPAGVKPSDGSSI